MKKMYYYIYYIPNKNMPYLTHPLKKLQVLWSLWVKQNQMKKILKFYNILLSNTDKSVPSDLTPSSNFKLHTVIQIDKNAKQF